MNGPGRGGRGSGTRRSARGAAVAVMRVHLEDRVQRVRDVGVASLEIVPKVVAGLLDDLEAAGLRVVWRATVDRRGLSSAYVAQLFGVSRWTIHAWSQARQSADGRAFPVHGFLGRRHAYKAGDIVEALRSRGLPVPEELASR